MNYIYFGNTTLRVNDLLFNIETQLLLFDKLFKESSLKEEWSADSLQLKYADLLIENSLLDTSDFSKKAKNARAKSSPLENFGFIIRKDKKITPLGYEVLNLIKNEKFKEKNSFLQIDLISMFFLKAFFKYEKGDNYSTFKNYLRVFKEMEGYLNSDEFLILPLIINIEIEAFITYLKKLRNSNLSLKEIVYEIIEKDKELIKRKQEFIEDYEVNKKITRDYFNTGKGSASVKSIQKLLSLFKQIIKNETIKKKFTKEIIINKILPLFNNRNFENDKKIQKLVTLSAKIPTIFEYIVAIAWYYIDEENIDIILNAGMSLDNEMLPKSHAVGGSGDIVIKYSDHLLMLEVTLTESTNQRRAEMEPVSRHLGNLLLGINEDKHKKNSYAIFIAPYLNDNVLNDFRAKQYTYWQRDEKYITGMNILSLDVFDIIHILNSNIEYKKLKVVFYNLLNSKTRWGSKWYKEEVKENIKKLANS